MLGEQAFLLRLLRGLCLEAMRTVMGPPYGRVRVVKRAEEKPRKRAEKK